MFNRLAPGQNLELVKWIAVLLMAGDHINKYLFNGTQPFLFEAGRLAMPLFALVLSAHLSRQETNYVQLWRRLFIFAVISTPFYIALGGVQNGLPLNILYTLLAGSMVAVLLYSNAYMAASVLFVLSGFVVEFGWAGSAVVVTAALFFRYQAISGLALVAIAIASLVTINGNHYALLSLPMFYVTSHIPYLIPRIRLFFYVFYPLHLVVLLLVRIPMAKAGYLFFL